MSGDARQANGLESHRSYDPPPAGFDPLNAPDELLLRHSLPRRPEPKREPELARIWERAFGRPLTYVKAEFAIDQDLRRRNPLQVKDPEFGPNNWAAAIVRAGGPFSWVFAEWVIPEVPQIGLFASDVTIGFWVGIDGVTIGDDQVLQAGVRVTMRTELPWPPHVVVDWKAFSEWWVKGVPSSYPVYLPNFPVKPGDTVSFVVCAPQPGSPAWVNILNASTGWHTAFDVPTPVGSDGELVTLQGDSVEWVVEVVEPAAPNLPQFDPITFNDCWAGHGEPASSVVDLTNADGVNIAGPAGDLTAVRIVPPHTATVHRI